MTTDAHGALIYTMVLASVADKNMTDAEVETLSEMVRFLPVFRGFDIDRIPDLTRDCIELLQEDDGIDRALDLIFEALPDHLRETAYAIACDSVAADGRASQPELRLLELMRDKFEVDRLVASAIERGSRARHRTL
jgi:tellurite resistance protein